jgi:DNA repair protein RadC
VDIKSDLLAFYKAIQVAVRSEAGKALPPLLKRWRYRRSADHATLAIEPGALRFLTRVGLLDAGADNAETSREYQELLTRISRSSGDAGGIVAGWIELFGGGHYGVMQSGVCAPEPRCASCPLKASCRYLAAGAKDSRSFGQDMAQELSQSSAQQPADLRVADLLAFVLSGERSGAADIARAEAMLKACRGLRGVFLASATRLRELGLTDPALARLNALSELCRLWAGETSNRGKPFACGQDFYNYFHLRLRDLKKEVFLVAMLDQKNALIAEDTVSEGSLTETLVHPREVFAQALRERAAAVALIHNHPSGDPSPSPQDKNITRRLESVASLVGIRLLDHVIIGDGRFYSFVEDGELD